MPCSLTYMKPNTQKMLAMAQLKYAVLSDPIRPIKVPKMNCIEYERHLWQE